MALKQKRNRITHLFYMRIRHTHHWTVALYYLEIISEALRKKIAAERYDTIESLSKDGNSIVE